MFIQILLILEIISTVIFLIGGIVTVTKHSLKVKVRIYLETIFLVANSLWLWYCIVNNSIWYMWVAVMYIIMGIFGIFNFRKIYKKEKKKENVSK